MGLKCKPDKLAAQAGSKYSKTLQNAVYHCIGMNLHFGAQIISILTFLRSTRIYSNDPITYQMTL